MKLYSTRHETNDKKGNLKSGKADKKSHKNNYLAIFFSTFSDIKFP